MPSDHRRAQPGSVKRPAETSPATRRAGRRPKATVTET
jgi:hypothetical protein